MSVKPCAGLSFQRLISDDRSGRSVETQDGEVFTLSFSNAEPKGYLDAVQARNGVIHLISSRQHYEFNLKWLTTRPPS
jgi:formylglycine-generating enzyme